MTNGLATRRNELRIQQFGREHLVRSSITLIITQILTAFLGYGYWVLVAHRWSAPEVGAANSVMAAALLCALISGQGLVPAVLLALPRADSQQRASLTVVAVAGAGVLALLTGVAAIAIAPWLLPSFQVLRSPSTACWFLLAVLAQAAGTVVDSAAVALRARTVVLSRNLGVSVVKIALLVASVPLHLPPVLAVLATVALPGCLSVLGALAATTRRCRGTREWSMTAGFHALKVGISWHYLSSLSAACPQYLLVLVITARLGLAQNAYFSMAWLLSTAVFMVSPAISQALLAEGARTDVAEPRQVRHAVQLTALVLPIPMIILAMGGELLLAVFGTGYVRAWPALIILAVGSVPDSAANILCAILRVRGRLRASATVNVVIATAAVLSAWWLAPSGGITAVASAWALAQVVGAATAYPALRRPTAVGRHRLMKPVRL
jgi:O-antigen/teichoic acid export membrane protein